MMMSRVIGLLVALMAAGCGSSFFLPAPPGFVELEDQEPAYDYRATSADGVVIGVREIDHEPKGDMSFWQQAVQNRLRTMAGYALLDTREVVTQSGLKGKQLRFGYDSDGRPMRYDVTLFVTDDHIYVVEFGGPQDEMNKQSRYLDWVLDNFRLT